VKKKGSQWREIEKKMSLSVADGVVGMGVGIEEQGGRASSPGFSYMIQI